MSNGPNEPIEFTRNDAERLAVLEEDVRAIRQSLSNMTNWVTWAARICIASAIGTIIKLLL